MWITTCSHLVLALVVSCWSLRQAVAVGDFYIVAIITVVIRLKTTLGRAPTYWPHEKSFTLSFTIFA